MGSQVEGKRQVQSQDCHLIFLSTILSIVPTICSTQVRLHLYIYGLTNNISVVIVYHVIENI